MTDTLTSINPTGSSWDAFYLVAAILVAAYEIIIRFIPTVADYTIIGFIYRLLDFVVDNRAKKSSATNKVEKLSKADDQDEPAVFKIFKRRKGKK
jgi:hypothetical protein